MIYTVTLNPAIDKTVVIPNFSAGNVNRIQSLRTDAGGKGINVSKCLNSLGAKSISGALLGGSTGEQILSAMTQMGLNPLHVAVSGQTRTNLKIIDPERGENTDINEPGPEVSEASVLELRNRIGDKIRPGDIVILSGSLPKGAVPSLYREWTDFFNALGATVFLDADGEPMRQGILASPYLVKPNDLELSRIAGRELTGQEALIEAGEVLRKTGIREVVISLGAEGAIFLSADGRYKASSLHVPVLSTVGAGDSMVAAMAYGLEKGLPREKQIRLAVAMGAASVMCDGSQAPDAELVWQLAEKVEIQEV